MYKNIKIFSIKWARVYINTTHPKFLANIPQFSFKTTKYPYLELLMILLLWLVAYNLTGESLYSKTSDKFCLNKMPSLIKSEQTTESLLLSLVDDDNETSQISSQRCYDNMVGEFLSIFLACWMNCCLWACWMDYWLWICWVDHCLWIDLRVGWAFYVVGCWKREEQVGSLAKA